MYISEKFKEKKRLTTQIFDLLAKNTSIDDIASCLNIKKSAIKRLLKENNHIKVMFIGQDGSMNLKNGETYIIKILNERRNNWVWISINNLIEFPYESYSELFKNWKIIKEDNL